MCGVPCIRYNFVGQAFQSVSVVVQVFPYPKRASQFAASFPSHTFFRASAVLCHIKSLSINCLGYTFVLYLLAVNLFWASFLTVATFLLSFSTSKLVLSYSSFKSMSLSCLRTVSSPTSTSSIASLPHIRLKGDSPVESCGEQRYPHCIWSSSSTHPPFASPSRFFNSWTIILLAASA